jgi:uncharacterized protein YceK
MLRFVTLMLLLFCCTSFGCATIRVHNQSNDKPCKLCGQTTPYVYGGTVNSFRTFLTPYQCLDNQGFPFYGANVESGMGYLLLAYPIMLPFLAADIPLSFAADTIVLPYSINKQGTTGNACGDSRN